MTLLYKFCSSCKLTSSKLTTFSCLRPLNRSFVASRIVSDLDSTTATIEQALHQVKSDDAGKLFPWRNRPFHRAHSSILQRFLSFGFISLINNSESNFLEGSKQAFRIGSQAIFSHVIPDTKQEHKIDLSSIFQDELAHFYTLAIRDFHHHNNKKIVYDLIAIKHAKIVDTEFVVWKSDLVKSGSIPFVEKIGYFTYVSNPDKEFNPAESDRLSVLIRVDLKCRGNNITIIKIFVLFHLFLFNLFHLFLFLRII